MNRLDCVAGHFDPAILSPPLLNYLPTAQKTPIGHSHTRILIFLFYYKASEVGEMDEKTEEPEVFQRSQDKLMDPEKFAFVQKYLEDVQDTRSMTTEATDSGLATQTAASELGIEEINGKCLSIFNFCKYNKGHDLI